MRPSLAGSLAEIGLQGTAMRKLQILLSGLLFATSCSPQDGEDLPRADKGAATDAPAGVGELIQIASTARGFPVLRDLDGRMLAEGDFVQWFEDGRLHLRIRYDFENGRRIEEEAVFGPSPEIVQERWSWNETREGQMIRRFEVDFRGGTARAKKRDGQEIERWSEEIDVEPGRAFAGFGFTLALKAFRERLVAGEAVELEAVGFTPDPRVVGVELSHGGLERMRMSGRMLTGDRFDIEPQIPWIADLLVDVPDTRIWLTEPPAEFLRFEGPLLEPDDPVIRIDLLPGNSSGPAESVEAEPRRRSLDGGGMPPLKGWGCAPAPAKLQELELRVAVAPPTVVARPAFVAPPAVPAAALARLIVRL